MAREQFKDHRFQAKSEQMIAVCNSIVDRYQAQGLRLTLRQLYYQLVVINAVPNTDRAYDNLGALVSDARLAGRIDWDAIEDRIRMPRTPLEFLDPQHRLEAAIANYRLDRWAGQEYYVELWVEKDALAGVLQPIASAHHITLMVNRGYSSQTAMHDAYERFGDASGEGKGSVLLYLGDHDPSGEDMVRDINDRLNYLFGGSVRVEKLAITPLQVARYNPPANPAKMTDSRAAAFVERYGSSSYEVDALPPDVLTEIINAAVLNYVDDAALQEVLAQERRDKDLLREAGRDIMKKRS